MSLGVPIIWMDVETNHKVRKDEAYVKRQMGVPGCVVNTHEAFRAYQIKLGP